ncbi:hypothetical protein RCL1_005609 [Eukaryota sp. TZLM3-RCL]
MSIYQHQISSKLITSRTNEILTDCELVFGDTSFHYHLAISVHESSTIRNLASSNDRFLVVPENVYSKDDTIASVLESFCGRSFNVSNKNAIEVFEVSKFLGIDRLLRLAMEVVHEKSDRMYVSDIKTTLSLIQNDQFCDFTIVYNSVRLHVHKFLLATVCCVFKTKFELEPAVDVSDYSSLLTVNDQYFADFFNSFYKDSITITLENLFDISHLAFYFKLDALRTQCDDFLHISDASSGWIFPALVAADKADDDRFVVELCKVLGKISNLSDEDPVAVKPRMFSLLTSNVDVHWLTRVLVHSFFHYDQEDNVWGTEELGNCLNLLSTNKIEISTLYSILY